MKKIFFPLYAAFVVLLLVSCKRNDTSDIIKTDKADNGLNFSQNQKEEQKQEYVQPSAADEKPKTTAEDGYAFTLNNANVFNLEEEINIDGIKFKNLKANVQKELPEGITKNDVTYFYEQADEVGILEDEYTYIFADISIKNDTAETKVIYLSGGSFSIINENQDIIASTSELRYRSNYESIDETKKDYNRCEFEPGEEKQLVLGYIAENNLVEQDSLYYTINLYGYGTGGENIKAFKVW